MGTAEQGLSRTELELPNPNLATLKCVGLTINWNFNFTGTAQDARGIIRTLKHQAQDLPFAHVSDIVELKGAECKPGIYSHDDPRLDTLRDGRRMLEYDIVLIPNGKRCSQIDLYPKHVVGFYTEPGADCEVASFGLCRYPAEVEVQPRRKIATGLGRGWHWSQCCKTQFASNPKVGGINNFLLCHLSVIALLDAAAATPGLAVEVDDEGEFWTKRNVPALVQEVTGMNEAMAAMFSNLQSSVGPGLESSMQRFPNLDQLETAGINQPQAMALCRLLAKTKATSEKLQ